MKTAQDFNSNFEQYNAQIEKEIANLNRMREELQANGAVAQQIINDIEPVSLLNGTLTISQESFVIMLLIKTCMRRYCLANI